MNLMKLRKLLGSSPYFEVLVRNLYWRNPTLVRLMQNTLRRRSDTKSAEARISIKDLTDRLIALGVKEGDLLVVHSDYQSLKRTGESPSAIIEALRTCVGSSGTIAMPAIPLLKGQPKAVDLFKSDVSELLLDYNVQSSPAWTGAIPNALIKYPGAIRSLHPLNTMAAVGAMAESMMVGNLEGHKPLSCGLHSPWYFCYQRNAKVVALGVDMAHSLTMIHVAEDMNEEVWSRRGWYRDRLFRVTNGEDRKVVTVRERHPKWAMFFAERTLSRDLLREKILTQSESVPGVSVALLESKPLVDYLTARNRRGYPYYLVPSGSS